MAISITPDEIVKRGEYPLLTKHQDWERVPLGQIATVQNGFPFESRHFDREEGVPLIRIRDVPGTVTEHKYTGEYDSDFLVYPKDILVGMDGDFRAARWNGPKGLLNQRVCRIVLTSEHFDEDFLFLCLQPFLNAINAETSSVTVKHLSSRSVEQIPLPLPPVREQRRIVAKIEELFSELDKGIEALSTARQQLIVYRQSVLTHAFEGKLTETWRAGHRKQFTATDDALARIRSAREAKYATSLAEWHNAMARWRTNGQIDNKPSKQECICEQPAFSPQDLDSLPSLPPNWTWVRLGELFSSSPQNGLYKPASSYGNGTPIIRIDSFYDGVITRDIQFKKLTLRPDEIGKYRVNVGDVLINRVNSIEYLGKCALVTKIEEPTVFESNIMKFSILDSEISNRYLVAYLTSRGGKNRLCQNAKHAVNQASINQTDVAVTPVPVAPIAEQKQIVRAIEAMLSEADRAENDIEIQLARANALRQSILKQAFSGQLVAQDATDEPASSLLARIRVEREESESKKKRNGKNGKKNAA